jgi:hypothetical protein
VEQVELRCDNGIKFAELYPDLREIAVKCRSGRCGAARGVVVIHTFDLATGRMVGTERYRDPVTEQEEGK